MSTEHIEILDIERTAATGKIIVDLAIIVKQKHSLLGKFFAGEVVGLHFNGRW